MDEHSCALEHMWLQDVYRVKTSKLQDCSKTPCTYKLALHNGKVKLCIINYIQDFCLFLSMSDEEILKDFMYQKPLIVHKFSSA